MPCGLFLLFVVQQVGQEHTVAWSHQTIGDFAFFQKFDDIAAGDLQEVGRLSGGYLVSNQLDCVQIALNPPCLILALSG